MRKRKEIRVLKAVRTYFTASRERKKIFSWNKTRKKKGEKGVNWLRCQFRPNWISYLRRMSKARPSTSLTAIGAANDDADALFVTATFRLATAPVEDDGPNGAIAIDSAAWSRPWCAKGPVNMALKTGEDSQRIHEWAGMR